MDQCGSVISWWHFDGILPKGPYPPCLCMADRALLAGYPWFPVHLQILLLLVWVYATFAVEYIYVYWLPSFVIWYFLTNEKLILGEVMALCCQATSHNLAQCRNISMLRYAVTGPQLVWLHFSYQQKKNYICYLLLQLICIWKLVNICFAIHVKFYYLFIHAVWIY